MQMIEARQQKFLDHIEQLEESLATASTADKDSLEYQAAIKHGKKVQKKRKAEDQKKDEKNQPKQKEKRRLTRLIEVEEKKKQQ